MKRAKVGGWVLFAMGATLAGGAEPTAPPVLSRYAPAVVTATSSAKWPGPPDREALVRLQITISAEGEVTNIEVADEGFHEKRFVNAAMIGARSMRFRPATLDGKPIESTVIQPFAFHLGEGGNESVWATGITYEFRREMEKVEKLLKQKDYPGANFHADWMLREKVKYGYEYAVLKAELALTQELVGRYMEALQAAEDATQRTRATPQRVDLHQPIPPNSASNYLLPKEIVVRLLELRMRTATRLGLYLQSLAAYYELAGLTQMSPDDPRAALARQIVERLEGNERLAFAVRIGSGTSYQPLFRPRFTLERVQGDITSLDLYCGPEHQELHYAPAEEWTIPEGWTDCLVKIRAEPGTSFVLAELAR